MHNYQSIQVKGYYRSGNHYLASLISHNFFDGANYMGYTNKKILSSAHVFGNNNLKSDKICIVHIFREFDNVAKSMFVLRRRFGLGVDGFDIFLKTKLSDMWQPNLDNVNILVKDVNSTRIVTQSIGDFKNVNMTLKEHWTAYIESWNRINFTNIIRISYEDLINDFQNTMLKVANKINSSKKEFININDKVGWVYYRA